MKTSDTNDQASSYRDHVTDEAGGRYARQVPFNVTGSSPAAQFPALPPSSPWHGPDPVPIEPPLGIDVSALEPVGTPTEIEASLAASLEAPTSAILAGAVETGDAAILNARRRRK